MNGYFQLICTPQETAIRLVPPTEDGEAVDINEITSYLQFQNIYDVDIKPVFGAIKKMTDCVVKIGKPLEYPVRECVQLRFSEDKMQLIGRFYPPQVDGERMSADEIIQDIHAKNVQSGIAIDNITSFVQNPVYCTDTVLAEGVTVRQGQDARIEYTFHTELNAKPTRNPDGSVDFFHLNTICHCKQGEVLARLIKEVPGTPGYNLFGEKIMPRDVKSKKLKYGNNIELSEDGTTLTSQIDGHVSLVGDKVFVSNVYEVENVGPSTGNIESEGSVIVGGNVQAGYAIKAKGNVIVNGVVEGAVIEAGGDIILARGMNGMGKGILRAGGSVISKFFENSTIYSGTFVEADSILHSTVVAQTEVNVDGRKGFIAGGNVRATRSISCKTLGSAMGADTYVEVGVDPNQKLEHQQLRKEMLEIQKTLKTIQPVLIGLTKKVKSGVKLTVEQVKYLQTLMEKNVQLTERLDECEQQFDFLEEQMQGVDSACIKVREDVYSGTKINIRDASLVLKKSMCFCRFIYDKGGIKIVTY